MTEHSTPTPGTDTSGDEHGLSPAERWIVRTRRLLADCGIDDWPGFVARVRARRSIEAGGSLVGWSEPDLLVALRSAVRDGQSAVGAPAALLWVAADPATRSPRRVADDGPWWAQVADRRRAELRAIGEELDATDGLRPRLQALAREQLAAESRPLTQEAVLRRAQQLLPVHQWAASLTEARESVWAKAWRLTHRPLLRHPQPPQAPPHRRRGRSR
jgi:hypothetical protein